MIITDAIDQKSRLLAQITGAFRLPYFVASVTLDDLVEFYSMVACNLFDRTFPETAIEGIEAGWGHLSLVYVALNASFALVKSERAITEKFIIFLTRNTVSFDGRERETAARSLLRMHETYPRLHDVIIRAIYNLLFQGLCSNELLDFVAVITRGLPLPVPSTDLTFYTEAVLHIFSFTRVYPRLLTLVLRFLNKSAELFPDTVSYLLYHWPLTSPTKQVFFLNCFKRLFAMFSGLVTQEMSRAVFHLTAQALPSIHVETVFAARGLLKDESVRQLLQVFPEGLTQVLDMLTKVTGEHWDEETRSEAGFLFATLSQYGSRLKSRTVAGQTGQTGHSGNTWKLILAVAQRRDRTLHLRSV
jgi:hypothetical protein